MLIVTEKHNPRGKSEAVQNLRGEEGGRADGRGWEQIRLPPGEVLDRAGEGITLIPVPLTDPAGLQKVFLS